MHNETESIPLSPVLAGLYTNEEKTGNPQVGRRVVLIAIQAVINAVLIGFVAKILVALIFLITNISFYGRISFLPATPAGNHLGWMVVIIPVIGSILVGVMARYGSKAIRGHGIPEAMEKIISDESRIPPIITFLKPISSAISIGTGGPFGAEGPIIATGGAFGSFTGQLMHISSSERKIILTAGACAGMSAIFGSPLAAVLLALELLLFEFSPRSIIPVTLACVTGAGMHILLFGNDPVFAMPPIPDISGGSLIIYILLGALIGVIASLVSKSVYAVEDLFEHLPVHWMWWPAIGAIAVGITGYYAPFTMGVGYDNIQHLLTGTLPLTLLLSLCFLKYISWVIALGSGTSGGTLAPLFTIGGALGALIATTALKLFPGMEIHIATAALIGMAAMFAGASRAFLTSIVFAIETTHQSSALLPLIGACTAAYFVSFFLMKGSIMTEKIMRRGIKAPDYFEPDVLQTGNVEQLMTQGLNGRNDLPVVSLRDGIGFAAELMGKLDSDRLVVVDKNENGHRVGIITAASILKFYSVQKRKGFEYESPSSTRRIMVRGRKLARKIRNER
jgi:chloride channel protein, CIC family